LCFSISRLLFIQQLNLNTIRSFCSNKCSYSIAQQVNLFDSIKPLFAGKPLIIALNKIDLIKPENLSQENQELIRNISAQGTVIPMSTMNEEGVMNVKQMACEKLLEQRVDLKLKGKKVVNILNRLHLATPVPRDDKERPPVSRPGQQFYETNMETEEENSEELPEWMSGLNNQDWKKKYLLSNDDWKFDVIPEIMEGKNIADFIDPEIMQKLEELEKEEEIKEQDMENQMEEEDDDSSDLDEEDIELVKAIRDRKKVIVQRHRANKARNRAPLPTGADSSLKTIDKFESHLTEMGIDPSKAIERARSRSRSKSREPRKRTRSDNRERSKSRSISKTPEPGKGLRNVKQKLQADALARKAQKGRNSDARKGEADRTILDMKPKHLFTGKRGLGKTTRR